MKWWLALLILLAPSALASEGWYYDGDTFKIGEILYSVQDFGTHEKVPFSAGGRSFVIPLGECVKDGLSEYCYKSSAYPNDDDHIKYAAGNQHYGHFMSITSITPALKVSRSISTNSLKFGEEVEVEVTLENAGDYRITLVSYNEAIPEGMLLLSGPTSEYGRITYELTALSPGQVQRFKYRLKPQDYVSANLAPVVNYVYDGHTFNATVSPISLFVETPLAITRSATSTLNLGDTGRYVVNVSNKELDREMKVQITTRLPEGIHHAALQGFTAGADRTYAAELMLKPGENRSVSMTYYSAVSGTYRIATDVAGIVGQARFQRHYEDAVQAKADKLVPALGLSAARSAFTSGERITITGVLENVNEKTTFERITGTLSGPGLLENRSFRHDAFPPRRTITEVEIPVVMPEVNETTQFLLTFSGLYATPGGEIFDFTAQRHITVAPDQQVIAITRSLDPAAPVPGQNVTVTVAAKNVNSPYTTFSSHELFDSRLSRVGGITYAETSLERDQSKVIYTYQLEIPANFTEDFNLTTQVLVKDQPAPAKSITTVRLSAGNAPLQAAEGADDAPVQEAESAEEQPGLLARWWNKVKSWFD